MNLDKFKKTDWIHQWAGNWSILSFSYWGDIYTKKPFSKNIDSYVDKSILIWKDGKSSGYQPSDNVNLFANNLSGIFTKNPKMLSSLIADLKLVVDAFLDFTNENMGKDISFVQYKKFQDLISQYYPLHIQLKWSIENLNEELASRFMGQVDQARVYAEPVFDQSEEFMIRLAKIHEEKTGYDVSLILATVFDEWHKYFENGTLPDKSVLFKRSKSCALLFDDKKMSIISGEESITEIENSVINKNQNISSNEFKGTVAYPGTARGVVKIVHNPSKVSDFNAGDILVTSMTRPDYMPLMKKAAAIITDAGGVLCHAAITARELKKVAIIGTRVATKVLKDGDQVEVDAINGIVRKI